MRTTVPVMLGSGPRRRRIPGPERRSGLTWEVVERACRSVELALSAAAVVAMVVAFWSGDVVWIGFALGGWFGVMTMCVLFRAAGGYLLRP